MKPHEFKDCTFRENKLFAQSFVRDKEHQLKTLVLLHENITDKLLYNDPNIVKKPQKIRLLDRYEDLFEEEYNEMVSKGMMRPKTKEAQVKFMKELAEEIKGGVGNDS
jgi:uncharacterized protein YjcR